MEAVHAERKQEIRIVPPKEYVAQVESKSAKKRKARESDDEEDNEQPDEKSGPAAGGPPLIMGVLTLSTPTGVDVAVIGTQWGSVLLYRLSDGTITINCLITNTCVKGNCCTNWPRCTCATRRSVPSTLSNYSTTTATTTNTRGRSGLALGRVGETAITAPTRSL